MTITLNKEIYTGFRNEGTRPIEMRSKLEEINLGIEHTPVLVSMIRSTLMMMMYFVMFGNIVYFWITSPSGNIHKQLPLKLALRIMRKQHWTSAEVEPIREISRYEALKILLFGDKPYEERYQG